VSLRYLLHRNSRFKLSVNLHRPLCLSSLTSSLANYRNCPAALASLINSECDIGRLLFTKINCSNIKFNRTLHRVIAIFNQFLTLGINFTVIYLSCIQNKLCITFIQTHWMSHVMSFDFYLWFARKYCNNYRAFSMRFYYFIACSIKTLSTLIDAKLFTERTGITNNWRDKFAFTNRSRLGLISLIIILNILPIAK